MTQFKIEKGVPLTGRGAEVYPFSKLEVGDSFFVPNITFNSKEYKSLMAKTFTAKTKLKVNLVARTRDNGVRIWRLANQVKI